MGRIVKYERVTPHHCSVCGKVYGQTSATRAWIGRAFSECQQCDSEAAALLIDAYRAKLNVVFIERGTE